MSRRILVCEAQVPFIRGGAESLVRELVGQLRLYGYDADLVSVPFKWYPPEALFSHAAAWRLLDLTESAGRKIDRVIATKFPTVESWIQRFRAGRALPESPMHWGPFSRMSDADLEALWRFFASLEPVANDIGPTVLRRAAE